MVEAGPDRLSGGGEDGGGDREGARCYEALRTDERVYGSDTGQARQKGGERKGERGTKREGGETEKRREAIGNSRWTMVFYHRHISIISSACYMDSPH